MGALPWSCVALTLMRFYPTAHALSVLWTHRYYTHVVAPTHSPTPISPFTSFSCSLAHTAPTRRTLIHSKTHSSHTHINTSLNPPSPPFLACHFAFGQHELEWSEGVSAMHMKCSLQWTCMWVGRTVKSSVSQSSQSQPEEQTGRANLLSVQPRRRHIWANLFRALLFFFSMLTFFFWWATPSHWLVAAFVCFSFCIRGSSFSLYSERKREIFVV